MLHSLRVRNFRSFSSSDKNSYVEIKPLTVLLGKNSSGKSSFLRTFPLLRQSVEKETTGPILWYGSYVDFGAFSEVKNIDTNDEQIYFDFKISIDYLELSKFKRHRRLSKQLPFGDNLDITVELCVAEEAKKTLAKKVKIKIFDETFIFLFKSKDSCQLEFNGSKIQLSSLSKRSFIPIVGQILEKKFSIDNKEVIYHSFDDDYLKDYFWKDSLPLLKNHFHSNTSDKKIIDGVENIGLCDKSVLVSLLKHVYADNSVFIKNLKINPDAVVEDFHKVLIKWSINNIIDVINIELERVFKGVRYIAPLRATAERYYRHQDLQVNEIDHTGSNLAMLLRSLTEQQKKKFSSWTNENFGFSVRVEELGLHYALKIKNKSDAREYNINDMGFGFSQILPIVASIWFESNFNIRNRRRNSQLIFAIEQPELHLHPEYQARLANLFAKVVHVNKKTNANISIIFETHSQTMIEALGDCIEDGEISNEDINVVIFEKVDEQKFTNINFSKFNNEGDLIDWPIGFFSGR